MSSHLRYKYCLVPMCTNTTVNTPSKVFLSFPKNEKMRKKWCNAMKRDPKRNRTISLKSHLHCCEDHFNLEEDVDNYMRVRFMGGVMHLKKSVIPHKFECQKKKIATPRQTGLKRSRLEIIKNTVLQCKQAESKPEPQSQPSTSALPEEQAVTEPLHVATQTCSLGIRDKAVQVSLKRQVRSKATATSRRQTNTACSPMKWDINLMAASTQHTQADATRVKSRDTQAGTTSLEPQEFSSDSDSIPEDFMYRSNSPDFAGDNFESESFKAQMRKSSLMALERSPRLCLGIPKQMFQIISILANKIPTPVTNILITLKKIRLDDSFAILSLQFGISVPSVSRIFMRTVLLMDRFLKSLIVWPSADKIRLNLPISFRSRYAKVQSIIDCLEIQINKPNNPIHQSLTWSEYKSCNTLKYLVSCTPDGLVNYISCGYGGRASDATIVEDCGYLDALRPGTFVMADRGFKNISNLLQIRQCELIRPPSVFTNVLCTAEEVKQAKRIAALRIHVERVISRIREFNMCKMHASTHHNHIPFMDQIIRIVCALINLQSVLIKV